MTADPAGQEPFQVAFDITVVDGEDGRRLAALQADAILEVLTWFHEHAEPSSATLPGAVEGTGSGQPAATGGA